MTLEKVLGFSEPHCPHLQTEDGKPLSEAVEVGVAGRPPSCLPHSPPNLHPDVSLSWSLLFLALFVIPPKFSFPGKFPTSRLAQVSLTVRGPPLLTSFIASPQCLAIISTPACLICPRSSRAGSLSLCSPSPYSVPGTWAGLE